jgi:hypothetical protein
MFAAGAVCLYFTATHDDEHRLFFGRWHARHFALTAAAFYVGILSLLACKSKRAVFAMIFASLLAAMTVGIVEVVGLFGIVSFPRVFGCAYGDGWHFRVVPNLDAKGTTLQDLAYALKYPSEPIAYHYVTDRRGFRNGKDRDEADIYLVGDSILVAALLPFEETLTALLEKKLGVQTMNVAIAGLAVQEERDLFKTANLSLRNRLVLQFVFEGNDLPDSARYRDDRAAGRRAAANTTFSHNLLLWLMEQTDHRKLIEQRRIGTIGNIEYLFGPTGRSFQGFEAEFPHVCEALLDMQHFVTSSGGAYAIVYMPEKLRVLGPFCELPPDSTLKYDEKQLNPLRSWLTDWCREQGIDMLDLTDALAISTRVGAVPWFPADTHPNAIGHQVAATEIENWSAVTSWMNLRIPKPPATSNHTQ